MNQQTNHWLDTAEFLSLSAAVVGTVASGVSQQAILATAPLSVSLALNLANRRRVDRLIQRQADDGIQQLHKDFIGLNDLLAGGVDAIRQQLLAMPTPPEQIDITPVETIIEAVRTELESRLLDLELVDFDSVQQGVTQLQAELAQLRQQIQVLFQDDGQNRSIETIDVEDAFDPAKMFDLGSLQSTDIGLGSDLIRSPQTEVALEGQSFTLTDSEIGTLQEWQNAMAQEVITAVRTEIQNSLPSLSAVDASTIQERLLQLQAALVQLNHRMQSSPAAVDVSALQSQLDRLTQRFEQWSSGLDATGLTQRLDTVQSAIAQLSDEIKTPPANDDTALIFSAMRSLYERQNSMEQDFITAVRSEIQTTIAATVRAELQAALSALPAGGAAAEPSTLHTDIAELRAEVAQLHQELRQTTHQPGVDLALFQAQISDGLAQLRSELVQVQSQLQAAPSPTPAIAALDTEMKTGFAQLQTAIVQLQTNLQPIAPAPVDLTPLQAQMEQINRRLNQLPPPFDPTSLERRLDDLSNTLASWQSDAKTSPPEESEFIFSAMRSLYERQGSLEQEIITAMKSELQKQVAPLFDLDGEAIQEGLLQLQVEVSQLKNRLQTIAQPAPIDLSPLQTQIYQVNHRLEQLPPPFNPAPLEQRIDELRSTITTWKEEMETSPMGEDLRIFLSAMRGMYDRRNGREG